MSINMKVLAIGSAGVVALAGAGLYAGVLTPTTGTSKVGAGQVALQASCTDNATITPAAATWMNVATAPGGAAGYYYTALNIAYTPLATNGCADEHVSVNVNLSSTGAELSTGTHTIASTGEGTAFQVTPLSTPVPASINDALYKYAIVFQTA